MSRGKVIALSGVDCAGKTTQRELLFAALHAFGLRPVTLWSRAGYTPGLEAAKRFVRALRPGRERAHADAPKGAGRYPRRAAHFSGTWRRKLWLTAALLDLLWVYGVRIRVLRALGRTVICDRYLLDCMVDLRVNFPDDHVERWMLWRLLQRSSVRPDAVFCMLVPAEVTLERARAKARSHREPLEVLEERRRAYTTLSGALAVHVLDGLRPSDEIAGLVLRRLTEVLPFREVSFWSRPEVPRPPMARMQRG